MEILDRSAFITSPKEFSAELLSPEGALILLDKPYGETSFFVVNRLRSSISKATGIRRIKCGHAGTLDPLATGLLIIATSRMTKSLQGLQGLEKTYLVRMRFGVTSPSFDLERPIELCEGADSLSETEVQIAIEKLKGSHEQVPPIFSAIKQHGKPVYRKARAGEDIILASRVIQVYDVELVSIALPEVAFRVNVSKGTYVRSIVRDLAASLGTCGILIDLVREAIGPWRVKDALTLQEMAAILNEPSRELQHS